jgi:hypothetical protein
MPGKPDDPEAFPDTCKGMYITDSGDALFLGNMFGSTYIAWHDLATGQVRVLYPDSQGHYSAGPAL